MKRLLCLLLLCAGCLDYEIETTTEVRPDGSFKRTVKIRETDKGHAWKRFRPAAAPYRVEGSEAEGFVAAAEFAAGRQPGGIRGLQGEVKGDYTGAEGVKDMPAVEGKVSVEVADLAIGKLYWYHETLALGVDPVEFRRALSRWLEVGLEILMSTLRHQMPDVDFEPVERHARREMIPKLERAVRTAHLALGGLLKDYREHRYTRHLGHWLDNPHAQVVLDELEHLGIARRADAPEAKTLDEYFAEEAWDIGPELKLLNDFLAPLEQLPARKRNEIKGYLLGQQGDIGEDLENATERLYPLEEEREKVGMAALRTAVHGFGVYMTYGFLDSFRFRHEVRLPGEIVRTNGDPGEAGVVRWELMKELLLLVSPQLTAYSFQPAEGIKPRRWSASRLLKLREDLWKLDADARVQLAALARQAEAQGWDLGKVLPQGHADPMHQHLLQLKTALGADG